MKAKLLQCILVFGILATTSSIVNAWQEPPVEAIILNWDPLWAKIGVEQCFDGSASYGEGPGMGIWAYEWDFGDGSDTYGDIDGVPNCTSDPVPVLHTYDDIDHYIATLSVQDYYNHSDQEDMEVYVVDISLSAGSTYICRDLVPIYLSVETVKMDDKARLMILDEPGAIKIWSDVYKSQLNIAVQRSVHEGLGYNLFYHTSDMVCGGCACGLRAASEDSFLVRWLERLRTILSTRYSMLR